MPSVSRAWSAATSTRMRSRSRVMASRSSGDSSSRASWAVCATSSGEIRDMGALLQRRGGVARHDAVAWGYARGADELGVDIIQNCEVSGFQIEGG